MLKAEHMAKKLGVREAFSIAKELRHDRQVLFKLYDKYEEVMTGKKRRRRFLFF